jgi:hypothetical protein
VEAAQDPKWLTLHYKQCLHEFETLAKLPGTLAREMIEKIYSHAGTMKLIRYFAAAAVASSLIVAPKALSQEIPANWDFFYEETNGDAYFLDTDSFITPIASRPFEFVVIKLNGAVDEQGAIGAIVDMMAGVPQLVIK